jgi:hypothetical protein
VARFIFNILKPFPKAYDFPQVKQGIWSGVLLVDHVIISLDNTEVWREPALGDISTIESASGKPAHN